MIVCPVCEHQQAQGDECDVCGRRLSAASAVAVATTPLAELEQTALVRPGINIAAERMAELEATRLSSGPDLPAQQVPELERTRSEVGAVPVQPMGEIDFGREVDDGARTAAPGATVTCRYCGNVQSTGNLCERCGMRLPRAAVIAPTTAGTLRAEDVWTRCRKCGSPAKAGARCGNCGEDVAIPSPV